MHGQLLWCPRASFSAPPNRKINNGGAGPHAAAAAGMYCLMGAWWEKEGGVAGKFCDGGDGSHVPTCHARNCCAAKVNIGSFNVVTTRLSTCMNTLIRGENTEVLVKDPQIGPQSTGGGARARCNRARPSAPRRGPPHPPAHITHSISPLWSKSLEAAHPRLCQSHTSIEYGPRISMDRATSPLTWRSGFAAVRWGEAPRRA